MTLSPSDSSLGDDGILKVPVALITGAGRGLGAATARRFAQGGYRVIGLDLYENAIEPCADEPDLVKMHCDVSDAASVERTITTVKERFDRIDVAVNAAGIDHTYWLEQLTVEQFDRILAVNLRGPFLVAKSVWPIMKQQGSGHIVNIASTAAMRAWTGASAYNASKFGVLGLSRAMNLEGRENGIRVTAIVPGGMRTSFFERFSEQGIPLPDPAQLQDPADVANAIFYVVEQSGESVIQELIITSDREPSWP